MAVAHGQVLWMGHASMPYSSKSGLVHPGGGTLFNTRQYFRFITLKPHLKHYETLHVKYYSRLINSEIYEIMNRSHVAHEAT